MKPKWVSPFFVVAALYDGVLGLLFLFCPLWAFETAGVTPPNHVGYVQFPALLLILFAILFATIARDPVGRRELIWYGVGLKTSYTGLIVWHASTGGIPSMWIPFAWADAVFLVLFLAAWRVTGRGAVRT
jgi:hypothetical protein